MFRSFDLGYPAIEYLTAGFRVGSYKILCASIDDQAAGFDAGTLDPGLVQVNGYLINK